MSEEHLKKQFNGAGFAFQLALEAQLKANKQSLQLDDIVREHPWFHRRSQQTGFVDLIVEKGVGRFIVECKRSSDAKWIFLEPEKRKEGACVAKCHWWCKFSETQTAREWDDVGVGPNCPTSQFCSIRGSGDSKQVLIDRLASELVAATEALADEESKMPKQSLGFHYVYFPIIVTNAELVVGKFNPADVNMETGLVDEVEFETVEAVHYRKALSVGNGNEPAGRTFAESNQMLERSVFVVTSQHLVNWFSEWKLIPEFHWSGYPWDVAKRNFHGN